MYICMTQLYSLKSKNFNSFDIFPYPKAVVFLFYLSTSGFNGIEFILRGLWGVAILNVAFHFACLLYFSITRTCVCVYSIYSTCFLL